MSEAELNNIKRRIDRLEKENGLLRTIGIVGLVLITTSFLAVAPQQHTQQQKVVEAQVFKVIDADGRTRAVLSANAEAGPVLAMLNKDGTDRAKFGTNALLFFDENHKRTVSIIALPGSMSVIELADATQRVSLMVSSLAGISSLSLGEVGKPGVKIGVVGTGPSLSLEDREGFKLSLGSTDIVTTRTGETHHTSAASLVMFDKDGNVIWRAP
jgi:hypothetical protein